MASDSGNDLINREKSVLLAAFFYLRDQHPLLQLEQSHRFFLQRQLK